MRENRTPGSARGAPGNGCPYLNGKNNMKTLATILLIAICLPGCSKTERDYELDASNFGADTLLYVEKEMGLKMPMGAKGLNFYYKAPIV